MNYKSKGERLIANYLEFKNIDFEYEKQIKIKDKNGMERIWYPDFYITEKEIIIEYFGMKGDKHYDEGTIDKKRTYKKNGYKVICVYPETLKKNWKRYLSIEIDKIKNKQNKKEIIEIKNLDLWKFLKWLIIFISSIFGIWWIINVILFLKVLL